MTATAQDVNMPETGALVAQTNSEKSRADALVVADQAGYNAAGEFLKGLKGLEKQVKETFEEPKSAAKKAHTAICDAEKKHLEPIQAAHKVVSDKMVTWYKAEEDKREAEERRLQEEARQREEQERLDRAAKLESQGKVEQAARVLETPRAVPQVKLSAPAAVRGVAMVKRWDARVDDLVALCASIGAGKTPASAVKADPVFLRAQAVAYKDNAAGFAAAYPGCVLTSEIGTSTKA